MIGDRTSLFETTCIRNTSAIDRLTQLRQHHMSASVPHKDLLEISPVEPRDEDLQAGQSKRLPMGLGHVYRNALRLSGWRWKTPIFRTLGKGESQIRKRHTDIITAKWSLVKEVARIGVSGRGRFAILSWCELQRPMPSWLGRWCRI